MLMRFGQNRHFREQCFGDFGLDGHGRLALCRPVCPQHRAGSSPPRPCAFVVPQRSASTLPVIPHEHLWASWRRLCGQPPRRRIGRVRRVRGLWRRPPSTGGCRPCLARRHGSMGRTPTVRCVAHRVAVAGVTGGAAGAVPRERAPGGGRGVDRDGGTPSAAAVALLRSVEYECALAVYAKMRDLLKVAFGSFYVLRGGQQLTWGDRRRDDHRRSRGCLL